VNRIAGIVEEERAITADTALRLARYFDTTPEFWLNLQTHHDLALRSAGWFATATISIGW